MEFEIVSKECIKPSSPTPHNLKNHNLGFLDRRFGNIYIPLVLYYPVNEETILFPSDIIFERLRVLKQSLSETLSHYYPIAGKIKDRYSIDCNDEGVYFVEAKVNCPLNEFLNHPDMSSFSKFLPDNGKWKIVPRNYIAAVQVTAFACGGIAVGVYISHTIADAASFGSFLKGWASVARKNTEEAICPKFDGSSLFPCKDEYPGEEHLPSPESLETKLGRHNTRRYVFDASAIAKLKAKASSSIVQNPTRVEIVTALFAKCIMASYKARSASEKPFLLIHAVNLRRRAIPPFSEDYMGNFLWAAYLLCEDKEVELEDLVCQLKEAIAKLNGDFVNRLQGDGGWFHYLEAYKRDLEIFANPVNIISFSSWCNLGFYDIDFGWGKPVWANILDLVEMGFIGVCFLMDTRQRDGIEAWICLVEEDVAALESDKEFQAFATIEPSPLK